jgi:hypothetical protein
MTYMLKSNKWQYELQKIRWDLYNPTPSSEVGKTACQYLKYKEYTVKNLSPTAIVHQEDGEDSPDLITNPLKMATIFNKFFRNKITTLRQKPP